MNNVVNVNLNVPQSDVNFLNKLVEKMGWGMTQSQTVTSSPKDKVELAKRLYDCIRLPEDFDYKRGTCYRFDRQISSVMKVFLDTNVVIDYLALVMRHRYC